MTSSVSGKSKLKKELIDDTSFELGAEDSFGNSTFRVVPQSYHTAANVSYENLALVQSKDGFVYADESFDPLETHLQRADFITGNPITPQSKKNLIKADESPTNYLKVQLNEIANSSPSRFLQNYADGSMGLIPIFPMTSSVPSSRDQTKNPTTLIDTTIVTTQFDYATTVENYKKASKKSAKIGPVASTPAKVLTTTCEFGQSSSIDDTTIESSSAYLEEPIFEKKTPEAKQKRPFTFFPRSTNGGKSLSAKGSSQKKIVAKRKATSSLVKSTPVKKKKTSNKAKPSKKAELPPVIPYSANRPKRNIARPKNYYEFNAPKEEAIYSSPNSSANSSKSSNSSIRKSRQPSVCRRLGRPSGTARSKNGCWTCRLRRKKCPEEKPECSECIRLGLQCDNSEVERPAYMNDKKASKRKMDEIKEITNMKKRIRMSNRASRFKATDKST